MKYAKAVCDQVSFFSVLSLSLSYIDTLIEKKCMKNIKLREKRSLKDSPKHIGVLFLLFFFRVMMRVTFLPLMLVLNMGMMQYEQAFRYGI